MDRLIDKIVDSQLKSGVIQEEDIPVYRYGYLLLFEMLLNVVAGIILGVMLGQLAMTFIFWLAYIPLRSYAGGWHASTFFRCFIVSLLSLVMALLITDYSNLSVNQLTFGIDVVCMVLISAMAPVDTKGKPLDEKEKGRYKRITMVILIIHALVFVSVPGLRIMLLYVHVILWVALVVQLVINKIQGMKENS